jgi:hypothetical protein
VGYDASVVVLESDAVVRVLVVMVLVVTVLELLVLVLEYAGLVEVLDPLVHVEVVAGPVGVSPLLTQPR